MSKLKHNHSNLRGILSLIAISLGGFAMGALCLYLAYGAISSGQLKIPTKYSSSPTVFVTPSYGSVFYYGFLLIYAFAGFAFSSAPFMIAWRFWRATPDQRERMLTPHMHSTSKRPTRILRTLLLFVIVPLVALFIIMIATILKSS